MATNQNNIIVGAATLKINGTDVGFTQGGVQVRRSTEYLDVEGDQFAGVVRKEPTMERMFVSTTMLEATFNNMMRAMNEPDANLVSSGSQLDFGTASPSSRENVLTIIGKAPTPSGFTVRTYTFFRAIASEDVEHMAGARDAAGVIPVTFECLKDDTQNNKFGHAIDSVS